MPRFLTIMIALGIIGLVGATFALLHNPSSGTGPASGLYASRISPKQVGNTAISHGSTGPADPTATIGLNDLVEVKGLVPQGAERAKPVVLYPAIPDPPPIEGQAPPSEALAVPPGTIATVVAIVPAMPPATSQTETYLKIQLKDGRTGWLPARAVATISKAGADAARMKVP